MVDFKIEKKTRLLLGLLGLVVTLAFVMISLGRTNVALSISLFGAVFIGLFLWIEAGVLAYVNKSEYKKITFNDVIVWASFVVGAALILQALFLYQAIANASPEWLTGLLSANGVTIGILGAALFVYHMFYPRPR